MEKDFLWCLRYVLNTDVVIETSEDLFHLGYVLKQKKWSKDSMSYPGILKNLQQEYVVLLGVNKKKWQVLHPQYGRINYTWQEAYQVFHTEFWVIDQQLNYQIERPLTRQLRQHFGLVKSLYAYFVIVLLVYELLALFEPLFLNFIVEHIDFFVQKTDMYLILGFAAIFMSLSLLLQYFRQYLGCYGIGHLSQKLPQAILNRVLSIPLSKMNNILSHDLFTRMNHMEQMIYRLAQQSFFLLTDALFFVFHIGFMSIFSMKLALFDALCLVLIFLIQGRIGRSFRRESRLVLSAQQTYMGFLLECLQGLKSLKLFHKEETVFTKILAKQELYWSNFLAAERLQNHQDWFLEAGRKMNLLLSLAAAFILLRSQALSMGGFIAIISMKIRLFARFESLCKRILQWHYIKEPLNRLAELFKDGLGVYTHRSKAHPEQKACIELQDFKVFAHSLPMNYVFEPGKNYLLKGASGIGKTSFFRALMGMQSAYAGQVLYHQMNCREDQFRMLQRETKLILQEDFLWQASVLDNICFFAQDYDALYLKDVLSLVGLKERVLSQSVQHLSGGEKQRVLLARALYQRPKWLFLDEATCHLDKAAEQELLAQLIRAPMGLIVVSHALDDFSVFDEVLTISATD